MFRLELVCDDKKLSAVYRALRGLVLTVSPPFVLENAVKTPKGLEAETNGTQLAMLVKYIKRKKMSEVNAQIIREFLRAKNGSEKSYGKLLRHAIEGGILKKTGKGTTSKYLVVTAPKKGKAR